MGKPFNVVAAKHPFMDAEPVDVPDGASIAEAIAHALPHPDLAASAEVHVNGEFVRPREWTQPIPPGAQVDIVARPADPGTTAAAIIALKNVASVSWWATQAAYVATTAAVMWAINALIPQPDSESSVERYSIDNAANTAKPWQSVPNLYGKFRVFADLQAQVVRDVRGDKEFIRGIVCWGVMPVALSDIKLGETLISNFGDAVQLQHRLTPSDPPITLYKGDHAEDAIGALLDAEATGSGPDWRASTPGDWTTETTSTDVDEITLTFGWRAGLGSRDAKGRLNANLTEIEIQISPTGAGAWTSLRATTASAADAAARAADGSATSRLDYAGTFANYQTALAAQSTGKTSDAFLIWKAEPGVPFRQQVTLRVPKGQYDVRCRRLTGDFDQTEVQDDVHWEALRSTRSDVDVVGDPRLAVTAFEYEATDQLSGSVDTLNAIAERLGYSSIGAGHLDPTDVEGEDPDFASLTASDWDLDTASRNPADALIYLLRGAQNQIPVGDDYIDWPSIGRFHRWCTDNGFEFNHWDPNSDRRRMDSARAICSAARARPVKRFGVWSVVIDAADSGKPQQGFSATNARGFRMVRTFPPEIHALRVEFVNADNGYDPDERIVYWDGYDEFDGEGVTAATRVEAVRYEGVTDTEQAWKLGRSALADNYLLQRSYELEVGIDSLRCEVGSRVSVSHFAMSVGLGDIQPRVIGRTVSMGSVTHLTLSNSMPFEAAKTYAIRWRYITGSDPDAALELEDETAIVNPETSASTIQLTTPIAEADAPAVGDLIFVGETERVMRDCIVRNVRKQPRLGAIVDLIDYAPERFEAWEGEVPAWSSKVTAPASLKPPTPTLVQAFASEEGIVVQFAVADSLSPAVRFEVKYRTTLEDVSHTPSWVRVADLAGSDRVARIPAGVPEDQYDVEITGVSAFGRRSDPLLVTGIGSLSTVSAPTNATVTPSTRSGPNGTSIPVLACACDAISDPHFQELVVEYRLGTESSDDDWIPYGVAPPTNPVMDLHLTPGQTYDVAFSWRTRRGVGQGDTIARTVVEDKTVPDTLVSSDTARIGGVDTDVYVEEIDAALSDLEDDLVVLASARPGNALLDPELQAGDTSTFVLDPITAAREIVASTPRALLVSVTADDAGEAVAFDWPGRVAVREGGRVEAGVDIDETTGVTSDVALQLVWFNAAGAEISATELDTGTSDRLAGLADAPANCRAAGLRLVVTASGAGACSVTVSTPFLALAEAGQITPSAYAAPTDDFSSRIAVAMEAIGSTARQLHLQEARRADAMARIVTLENTTIGAGFASAESVTLLEAIVGAGDGGGNLTSRVVAAETAIADLDSTKAEASVVTALSATAGANTTAIGVNASAISTIDGRFSAFYGVTFDVNGRISGFRLMSSGSSSSSPTTTAIFDVDEFQIGSAGYTDIVPFKISGGVVYIEEAHIEELSIGTSLIALGAITQSANTYTAGGVSCSTGTPTAVQTASITIEDDEYVEITVQVECTGTTNPARWLIELYRSTTYGVNGKGNCQMMLPGGAASGEAMTATLMDTDDPGPGTHTYRVWVSLLKPAALSLLAFNRRIILRRVRR